MKINFKFNLVAVAILLFGGIALGTGVHFLHAYQVRANARSLLAQADEVEKKDPKKAADYLGQYLGLVPTNNTDELARYGLLLDDMAKSPRDRLRPFFLLEQVLRQDDSRIDVRRRVVQIALAIGRFKDAREHLGILTAAGLADAEVLHGQALCESGEGHYAKAAEFYAKAVELAPAQADLCLEYANLLRFRLDPPRPGDATKEVDKMVAAGPRSTKVRLGAARYYQSVGKHDEAEKSVLFALNELKVQEPEAYLLAAEVARSKGQKAIAKAHLEHGRVANPDEGRLSLALARQEFEAGRPEEALRLVRPSVAKLPDSEVELWLLCNLLIDLGQRKDTEGVIRRLREGRREGAWGADFLEAHSLMRQDKWGEARALLDKTRLRRLRPEAVRQTDLLLATCYERLGSHDQQLRAARRALEGDPTMAAARRSAAVALSALGRIDEAIAEYGQLAKPDKGSNLELARLLMARNVRLPETERRWEPFDRLLGGLPADETRILTAEGLAARGKVAEARTLIEAECKRDPKRVEPWLFLAGLARRPGQPKKPLEVLDEAEKQLGPRVELCLARAGLWASTPSAESRQALAKMEDEVKRFESADKERLIQGLAQAFQASGDLAGAMRLWRDLSGRSDRQKADLGVRARLLELTYQAGEAEALKSVLDEARVLEGGDGPVTAFGEAARLMLTVRAKPQEKQALADAQKHLAKAADLRPSWGAVPLMEAEAAEAEGKKDKALEKYLAAMERGEGRISVIRRVIQLMAGQGQILEAQALMRKLPEAARAVGGLDRMSAELELRAMKGDDTLADRKRALEAARSTVAKDSKKYEDYTWLGHMALLAGEDAEAEKAFRRARDLNDKVPETWAAWLLLLARIDPKRAEVELTKAETRLAGPMPLVLASAYETLGQTEQGGKFYAAALEAKPNDPAVMQAVAGFYLRIGVRDKARLLLERLLLPEVNAPETTAGWARRALAIELAVGGNYVQFNKALDLVKGASIEDRQTRALVLATRPERGREAIKLFRGLSDGRTGVSPQARFVLARLHEADGNWELAQRVLLELLRDQEKNSYYLAYYVRALLRHDGAAEAEAYVDRFAKLSTRPFEVAELRARVLHATGKIDEAVSEIQKAAKVKGTRIDLAALLLEEIGKPAEAEKLFRSLAAESKDPRYRLLLAHHLARQGGLAEAVKLCEAAWQDCPPMLVAQISLAIVREPKATEDQRRAMEEGLRFAVEKNPKSPMLLAVFASIQDLRGKHDEAIVRYREVLEQAPQSVLVLNNLAYLLAVKGGNQEQAMELIEKAIKEQGPHAELLDTLAVVQLVNKRGDLALKNLREAVAMEPSSSKYFHLAQAYEETGDRREARKAMAKAEELKFNAADLHPLERPAVAKLTTALKGK